ncbi:EmrB/QacA subfamily drug resistance transporter [Paenibacillus endophyticus]|uniref:EmrB/QacA subfamily drug resistance transporter n=1 Tax=Paenibacillus endophyticus TaxID=1294268 RepID=A0A7W5C446_9BACL|nr:MFS transporter [Paenibacillus endophyticus]MBB3150532.1 EmrB/QacA subfamily drug resistance transporter [Paenibacillus endophyticus]
MIIINKSKQIMLAIIIACQLMIVLDASIMVTALPEIGRTLHLTTAHLSWVQNAYILAFGGLMLLGARAGDIWGRRRMFSVGIALFTLASILVGIAQSAEFLFITRALQGIAAAIATPSTLALLSVTFIEPKERTKAIALYSAVAGAGGSIGLILGGILTDLISWRVGMFLNVPIGIALLFMVPRFLPETEKNTGHFDLMGAMTSVFGITALVYGFVQAAANGWAQLQTVLSLSIGVVLLVAFVFIEARAKQPITPLRLFASRRRSGAYLGRFLFVSGNFSVFFFLPQFLQNVLGFTSFESGLAFLPFTAVQFGMMYLMPSLIARFGNLKVLVVGLIIAIMGTSWLSQISTDSQFFPQIFLPLMVMGIGAGTVFLPLTTIGLSGVDSRDSGAASGLINVAHQTGSSLGIAILITVFEAARLSTVLPSKQDFAHASSVVIVGSTAFIAASLVVVLFCFLPKRGAVKE